MEVCPTDVVFAPAERIWHLLTPGWRGQLVENILGRRIATGPARSLRRLKRAAEQDPILA